MGGNTEHLNFNRLALADNITSSEINLNYNVFRADRNVNTSNKIRGGGILIAVKKEFESAVILLGNFIESIYIHVKYHDLNLIVGGVYIPPASYFTSYVNFCQDIESIFDRFPESSYVIAGDFNLPHIDWNDDGECGLNNSLEYDLISSTCALMNLTQINKIPNMRNVFLDLIFSNVDNLDVCSALDPIFPSSCHHSPYSWSLSCLSAPSLKSDFRVFDFINGNYERLNHFYSSVCWESSLVGQNLDEKVAIFYEILFYGIVKFIPYKVINRKTSKYPYWFNKELKELCRLKTTAHCTFKNTGKLDDYLYFKSLRDRCNELIEKVSICRIHLKRQS